MNNRTIRFDEPITTSPVLTSDNISVWGELGLDINTGELGAFIHFCMSGGGAYGIEPMVGYGFAGLPIIIATHSLYYIVQELVKDYDNSLQDDDDDGGGLPIKRIEV